MSHVPQELIAIADSEPNEGTEDLIFILHRIEDGAYEEAARQKTISLFEGQKSCVRKKHGKVQLRYVLINGKSKW